MKKFCSVIIMAALAATVLTAFAQEDPVQTALDDLTGYGIIQGDPDGALRLNEEVTRAEMAKMIVMAQGILEEIAPAATEFSDVTDAYWASGYIANAEHMGIINGNGDGTFLPENPVTNEEAVKMIMVALGYKAVAEEQGGFPFGYIVLAENIGVLKDLEFTAAKPATRAEIVMLLHNALDIPLMLRTAWGAVSAYTISGSTPDYPLVTFRMALDEAVQLKKQQ